MKIEHTTGSESGKRFIEIDPITAKGIEVIKQLDVALQNANDWVNEVWDDNYYPYFKQGAKLGCDVYDWYVKRLIQLIGLRLDASNLESI